MLVYYHVKPGKEAEIVQDLLAQAWKTFQMERMVLPQPHTLVRDKEDGDKTRIVEIFSWVSHDAPDHAPDSVRKIWDRMESLCDARDGHRGIEFGEVDLLVPKK